MAEITKAHITTEACDYIIGALEKYSECLVESDRKMNAAVDNLSESHRDQNFVRFDDEFTPLWEDILNFKEAVDRFREHMQVLRKIIQDSEDVNLKL